MSTKTHDPLNSTQSQDNANSKGLSVEAFDRLIQDLRSPSDQSGILKLPEVNSATQSSKPPLAEGAEAMDLTTPAKKTKQNSLPNPVQIDTIEELKKYTLSLCPKCDAKIDWKAQSWCSECGYFPTFGMQITAPEQELSLQQNVSLHQAFPLWLIITLTGCVLICLGTAATSSFVSSEQTSFFIGLTQLCIGLSAFVCAHTWAYISGLSENDTVGLSEMFLKPMTVWKPTLKALPKSGPRVWLGAWALAAFLSALILGGVSPLSAFLKMDVSVAPDSLKSAASAATSNTQAAGDLKESVSQTGAAGTAVTKTVSNKFSAGGSISGTNGEGTVTESDQTTTLAPVKTAYTTDCVIIGYTLASMARLQSVLLAAEINGRLKFVGVLYSSSIPETLHESYINQLQSIRRSRPVVLSPHQARWVNPVIAVRVQHDDWTPSKKLINPVLLERLSDL